MLFSLKWLRNWREADEDIVKCIRSIKMGHIHHGDRRCRIESNTNREFAGFASTVATIGWYLNFFDFKFRDMQTCILYGRTLISRFIMNLFTHSDYLQTPIQSQARLAVTTVQFPPTVVLWYKQVARVPLTDEGPYLMRILRAWLLHVLMYANSQLVWVVTGRSVFGGNEHASACVNRQDASPNGYVVCFL